MAEAIDDTLAVNGIEDGYIRAGRHARRRHPGARSQPHAADPQVIIITDHIALYPDELYRKGLEIVTVSTLRNHPAALSPRIKSLNYLNNILAKIEGLQAGCIEALMLNHKGEVAECTGDNIFLVRDGELLTPPTDAGILEGITREAVIELAAQAGHRSARGPADEARRLHRRRVLPDRHGRRGDPGGQGRQPHDRRRPAGPDHARPDRAVSPAGTRIAATADAHATRRLREHDASKPIIPKPPSRNAAGSGTT